MTPSPNGITVPLDREGHPVLWDDNPATIMSKLPAPHPLGADRARRATTPAPAAPAPRPPTEITLKTHNLIIGAGPKQIYPSREVSMSLDGAIVNMGQKTGVVALVKQEVPHILGIHGVAHVCTRHTLPGPSERLAWS
jgi:hypothetical protein